MSDDEFSQAEVIIRTATRGCRRRRYRGDQVQDAWVALLEQRQRFNPERHHCGLAAFLVMKIRAHLSKVRQRDARHCAAELPRDMVSRELPAVDQAGLNERVARLHARIARDNGLG